MIEHKDSPFVYLSSYYKSRVLKATSQDLYSYPFGLEVVYDQKGEKRNERKTNKGFVYTIEDM